MQELEINNCIEKTEELLRHLDIPVANQDEKFVIDTLKYLWEQSNILSDRVQSRSESEGRDGNDYFSGVKLGDLAQSIADKFKDLGQINLREIALRIKLKSILQVQPHYHHIVGPAMLEHCSVLEELGRNEEAYENYECIIQDFQWLIDEYVDYEDKPNHEDYLALQSLSKAIEGVVRLKGDLPNLNKLSSNCAALLNRGVSA